MLDNFACPSRFRDQLPEIGRWRRAGRSRQAAFGDNVCGPTDNDWGSVMTKERTMAQEYGREGIRALMLVNGGAAVALLSQAAKLIELRLGDDVARALLIWTVGLMLAVLCWFVGFLSLRFADRAQDFAGDQKKSIRETAISNVFLVLGEALFLLSLIAFGAGCMRLAQSILALPG